MAEQTNLGREEAAARSGLVRDVRYAITLDLTGAGDMGSDTVVTFACTRPGAATFLDLTASAVESVQLNGRALPAGAVQGSRIHLDGLAERNEVRVRARCPYYGGGFGMYRFVDPLDGAVYCASHFEPFGANRMFACFDQPDLKAPFEISVRVPGGWLAASNAAPAGDPEPGDGGTALWHFVPTPPISTYIAAVVAGPYHVVRRRHGDVELGIWCRQSLAEHLDPDEIFEITAQGFDFYEAAYGYPYPFGKYDQVFAPEFTSGAMENAGCVIFNEIYVFRSRVTDALRERRADTILHELAHMWFGDLVTMRWWSDLWLNESFASYMAVLSQSEATRFTDAWSTFASTEKTWALRQDQLPTTHPIVADIPDIEAIHLNFDGITYAKGASVLRQLAAWVGAGPFLEGVASYVRRHEFANAELADFLAVLEATSGRDLGAWSKEWLETAGVNTLRADLATEGTEGREVLAGLAILQEASAENPVLRRHRLAVGLYDAGGGGLVRRRRVELDVTGERTEVPELAGEAVPDLLLVNDDDLTFAKVRLDPRSLAAVVERIADLGDPLARAVCWTIAWDMTRDAQLPARDYLRMVLRGVRSESRVGLVQTLLAQAAGAVHVFGDPANRATAGAALADATLEGARAAEPGSDHQLAWIRAFASAATAEEHVAVMRGLLDGEAAFDGLAVDTELRWHLVRALAAAGRADDDLIEAEVGRDPSDRGRRHAAAARAARPTSEAKAAAWRSIVEDRSLSLVMLNDLMGGFHQYGQEEVIAPYAERYFEALPGVWETRDIPVALAFGRGMYPALVIDETTLERTDRALAGSELPGPVRRMLLEGRDGVERAIRARARDRAAAG